MRPAERLWTAACWGMVALELAAWLILRAGDRYTLPTLALYGPRWVWLIPPLLLLPAAVRRVRRLLPLATALAIALFFVLGFELHLPRGRDAAQHTLTIVTYNAQAQRDLRSFAALVRSVNADVIALQEWDEDTGRRALPEMSIRCVDDLCLGSRHPFSTLQPLERRSIRHPSAMAVGASVTTPDGPVAFFSVHLETVRHGVEPVLDQNATELGPLRRNTFVRDLESRMTSDWIAKVAPPRIVAGDFNLAAEGAIYRAHWAGYSNAFDSAGIGFGYTKFTSWWGARIDHVLYDAGSWRAIDVKIGPDLGSDHRPVIATLVRVLQ